MKSRLYKGKYLILFYDKTDEELLYFFDNVTDILKFQKKEITTQNKRIVNVALYRALRTEEHFVTFLTGEVMRVYIINESEDDEND